MPVVVDASMAVTWCFDDETTPYSEFALDFLMADSGLVPPIWPYEVANALVLGERRGRIRSGGTQRAIRRLRDLPIIVAAEPLDSVWSSTLDAARLLRLTVYDASYLSLAIRQGCALATLDTRLQDAARRVGIPLLESDESEPR